MTPQRVILGNRRVFNMTYLEGFMTLQSGYIGQWDGFSNLLGGHFQIFKRPHKRTEANLHRYTF